MPKFKVTRTDGPEVLQLTVAGRGYRSSINAPNVIDAPTREALDEALAPHRCRFKVRPVGVQPLVEASNSPQDARTAADEPKPVQDPPKGQGRAASKPGKPSSEG